MAQRLKNSSSQYLRQHAHQQVDWYPYGDQAFEQARLRDVPVLLSIGYSACHWCHVMSHESFDDPQIAQLLNEDFVAIKVDREEHPLVDDTYMLATQAMTGSGGWPMTIFALPDGRAFHAGTYYPPAPRGNTPSFTQVLQAVSDAWDNKRSGLIEQASMLAEHLAQLGTRQASLLDLHSDEPTAHGLAVAADAWMSSTTPKGGFTPAPKFPASAALNTLWRTVLTDPSRSDQAFDAVATSVEALLLGGLYDHVGGGFARYCVDEHWSVPHFEKMLYDNAGLLSLCARTASYAAQYARGAQDSAVHRAQNLSRLARAAARGTARFLGEQLLTADSAGSFPALASSLDADSLRQGQRVEGAFYSYSRLQLDAVAAELDSLPTGLVRLAEIADDPGHYCLSLARAPEPAEQASWQGLLDALGQLRATRSAPDRDDKVIAGWNGLAIEALVEAAELLDEPQLAELAERVATTIWGVHWNPDTARLARVSFAGTAQHTNEGTLQDYAAVALGFLALAGSNGANGVLWAERADQILAHTSKFVDPATGVPRDSVQLDSRLRAQRNTVAAATVLDDALPAAGALYAKALARRALTRMADENYGDTEAASLEAARRLTAHALALGSQAPTQVATALQVQAVLGSAVHYVRLTQWDSAPAHRVRGLCRALGIEVRKYAPNPDTGDALRIYACREGSCQPPVSTVEQFVQLLHG